MYTALRRTAAAKLALVACSLIMTSLTACSTTPDVTTSLDVEPALATDAPHVERGGVNATRINEPPVEHAAVDFVGILANKRTNVSITEGEIKGNLDDLERAGVARDAMGGTVTIAFDKDSLGYVVKQLLGGFLSANYVVAEDLEGTVTFKTERPVPRTAVPSILRDILARNGYVMKLINGVYQIGTPGAIKALESNTAAGAVGDYKSRVIKLGRGNLQEVIGAVSQILPAGATLTPVASSNSLVLRVSPADEKAIVDLIQALIANSNEDDLIAIIRLRESAPETVASSIDAYFAASGNAPVDIPLVVPLEEQQALLVVARSDRVMSNVRTMVQGLDKENKGGPSLRIISLQNLPAAGIAEQLSQIFGGKGKGAEVAAADTGMTEQAAGAEAPPIPVNLTAVGADMGDSDSVTARMSPTISIGRKTSRPTAQQQAAPPASVQSSAAPPPPDQHSISIVPDERNNALLVYATYSEFKRIRDVVETLDVPLAQVVIEATIVEVALNDQLKYGVQAFLRTKGLSLRSSEFADSGDSGVAGGSAVFEVDAIPGTSAKVVLEALQAVTGVRIISSPYLTVLDGRAARLSVGDQIPYLVQQTNASQTGETTTTNQIEVRDVGIILEVTPNIKADNSVILNVKQEVSSTRATGAGETLTPVIAQRAINSDVVVSSGKTVLLGGLIQDRNEKVVSKVPGLSKVPLFGNLFKQTAKTSERTELLVMITPRVVRSSLQLEGITRLLRARAAAPGPVPTAK